MQIFSPTGSISTYKQVADGKKAYITLSAVGSEQGLLVGSAPITGVDIKQLTDYSVTKSLNKDFLVATFGDTPIQITLHGLNFFNMNGCALNMGDEADNRQILDFYKENRLSTDPSKRFDVAIASDESATVSFRCVIVGLTTQNQSASDGTNNRVYDYSMSLIGVDKAVNE
jgi:hypothetical protein